MKRRRWYMVRGLVIGLILGLYIVPAMHAAKSARHFEDALWKIALFAGVGLLIGIAFDLASQERLE